MESMLFLVQFVWRTEKDDGVENHLYRDYAAAYNKFKEIVEGECDPARSWVGDLALNANGEANSGYEVDRAGDPENEAEVHFHVVDMGNSDFRSFVDLYRINVK